MERKADKKTNGTLPETTAHTAWQTMSVHHYRPIMKWRRMIRGTNSVQTAICE